MAVVVLLIMLIAGLAHLFMGHFADAGVLLGFVGIVGAALHVMRRERQKSLDFLLWLQANQQSIEKGWSYYQGRKVTLSSMLAQYQACVSLVILTLRFRSPRRIVGSRESQRTGVLYTLISAVAGWWGVPWGFVYTPQAIYRNLKGGYRQTVKDLLPNVAAEIAHVEKKLGSRPGDVSRPTFASATK
jgi:hypothetical protein